MQWSQGAEEAIKKVPFLVRGKVRARVEKEARSHNKRQVTLAEVETTRKRYLSGMAAEVRGYQLDACFGPAGCPNAIAPETDLLESIAQILKSADLLGFLKSTGVAELKFHHEFRVTVAQCPNACSQPQIKDIGIIAAKYPFIGASECTACGACVPACRENAVVLDPDTALPAIDRQRCVACGQCIAACPAGTLADGISGYRIQLGGKLGRHPRLARELPGIYSAADTLKIISACIEIHKAGSRKGERFGNVLTDADFNKLIDRFGLRAVGNL